jgi:hypothetical protein
MSTHAGLAGGVALLLAASGLQAAPKAVSFLQSAQAFNAYEFVEVTVQVTQPDAKNPFTDVTVHGSFQKQNGASLPADGFCDSADGAVFRIRFMPATPGEYTYSIAYRQGDFERVHKGSFRATDRGRRGLLRVDLNHRWHFIWEGTGEHYFWNGTTAFLLAGWQDDEVINRSIDRFKRLKVNRIRLMLAARCGAFWGEPITATSEFNPHLNPWVAERPNDEWNPGFDYARFNIPYWQKFERMVRFARDRDVIISVIFDWNDSKVHAVAGSDDERRYFRYGVIRLAAYSNVTWDLGDDLDSFRDDAWTHETGMLVKEWDPYKHLATSHPGDNIHQDRTSQWFDFTSFQEWQRPIHGWMVEQRKKQESLGRVIPQTNEEYGYEDHYPRWSPAYPDGASADANRRAAWEISMAGAYQTTGETAKRGTGVWPDTGGGWVNGRGDDSMVLLKGQAHMVDFFTSFEWWKAEPRDDLADSGSYCLAETGKLYAAYLPVGGSVSIKLEPGRYEASWFNARTGRQTKLAPADGPRWNSPPAPDHGDWALLLRRM